MKAKLAGIWSFLRIPLSITISIKNSRRDLFIDIVVDRFIFIDNQVSLLRCFTFISYTMGLLERG